MLANSIDNTVQNSETSKFTYAKKLGYFALQKERKSPEIVKQIIRRI